MALLGMIIKDLAKASLKTRLGQKTVGRLKKTRQFQSFKRFLNTTVTGRWLKRGYKVYSFFSVIKTVYRGPRYAKAIRKEFRKQFGVGGYDYAKVARRNLKRFCPVRTGKMRRSISIEETQDGKPDIAARVRYTPYVIRYREALDRALKETNGAISRRGESDSFEAVIVGTSIIIEDPG